MVLTDVGLNELAERFAGDITQGQWGTGTNDPSVSDTGLQTAVSSTLTSLSATSSGNTSQFTHTVPSTTANSLSLTEFELRFDDGTNFSRNLGGTINKTASFEVVTISTISFVRQ